ncbi:MAG: hypothetical protein F6K36_08910 [Symploca sp. SIO3C6]|nr:hypothetical protein [Symploca sp. SIO3C6]
MTFLPTIYLSAAFYFFLVWFGAFKRDMNISPQQKRISWLVLIVATIFWPIVVPISYLERISNIPRDVY